MRADPEITVIIPHWNGKPILRRCLKSLQGTQGLNYLVLVVDNGSTDGSCTMVKEEFPEVQIVNSTVNLGFAAGCNLGIYHTKSPYVVLLNNDTVVTKNWLHLMKQAAERDPLVAAVQPKLLSITHPCRFDYCGAAGGEIDIFGYPYALGRLFNTMEDDHGQYDKQREIFWASGAAVLLRRSALDKVGLLDASFFAHMEEIDLNWRFLWAGYKVIVVPEAVVFHQTGATLSTHQYRKMLLNHRNSLLMVLKNHSGVTLLWLLPLRLMLEVVTICMSLITGQPRRAVAVLMGFIGVLKLWKVVKAGREKVRSIRCVSEGSLLHRMYRGSVVISYFIKGIRKASEL